MMKTEFTTFFGKKKIEALCFATQSNVNYFHEIIFLSSYLHDATFDTADLTLKKGTLTIPLRRDCWESWTRLHHVIDTLLSCPSVLKIAGIQSLKWNRRKPPKTMEVTSVFVGENHFIRDGAHLVFYSYGQKLRLDLRGKEDFFEITLRDLETPR